MKLVHDGISALLRREEESKGHEHAEREASRQARK